MATIKNKIESFLLSNTSWIFLAIIFFVSFHRIMVVFNRGTRDTFIYLDIVKWQLFIQFTGAILLLFSPILLFSFFRNTLSKQLSKWIYRTLWFYCFVVHTYLLFTYNIDSFFPVLRVHTDPSVVFGLSILGTELIIQFNDSLLQKLNFSQRLKKLNLESILFSIVILNILYWTYAINDDYSIHSIIITLVKCALLFCSCYLFYWLNHYILIEKIFKVKGIFYYLFAFMGLAMIFFPLFVFLIDLAWFQKWYLGAEMWIPKGQKDVQFPVVPTDIIWTGMFYSIPFILVYQWWKQKNDITILQKEKSESELKALKQQVNPHFLFNTLNSLYALGIEENGEKTADGIAKLGTLMRYNLHDAQVDQIALSKEVDYIQKYIELQELRLTDKNKLSIQIDETGMDKKTIAPMLLIPFIENAFKYGISPSEATIIDLKISLKKNTLVLQLLNTIIKNRQQKNGNGIGISNTRQRLAKLYPDKYELIIEETANEFEVHLEIDLK